MTLPRRVVPGTTYLISRRTLDRRFYLQPSAELNEIYEYALACACEKHGVLLHVYSGMSNHLHDKITDVRGVLPGRVIKHADTRVEPEPGGRRCVRASARGVEERRNRRRTGARDAERSGVRARVAARRIPAAPTS